MHTTAALAMRRQNIPEIAIVCLFNTLQEAQHHVCTAYGDSESHFGGIEIIPMHGICQGNGAGPAIWAVVSTPILDMLKSANLGSRITTPISLTSFRCCGFSFMDGTDTIQTASSNQETWQSVVQDLQTALNTWEGGLKATGGAIIP